jgi:cytochrome c peroxidase
MRARTSTVRGAGWSIVRGEGLENPKYGESPMRTTSRQPIRSAALAGACAVAAFVTIPLTTAAAQDLEALKEQYRRPPPRAVENTILVALGRDLFFEPRLSASGSMSCASCHLPELGWSVTDARSRNDSGKLTSRKSQPLIGIGHMGDAPVGWDGRSASLEAQAKSSMATGSMSMRETDAPVKVEVIEERIRTDPAYAAKFAEAMPGVAIGMDSIARAIAVFERTIEPGFAPFDRWIDGDERALSDAAKRGFVLFNGKANCNGCHNGWRFTDDAFHDIGTTTADEGRGKVDKSNPLARFAFKTPTLRCARSRCARPTCTTRRRRRSPTWCATTRAAASSVTAARRCSCRSS